MKKKLEAELISIAHRILKLSGKEDLDKMHSEVAKLYEKLTVLKFAQENFDEDLPTIGGDSSFFGMLDQAFNNTVTDTIEVEDKIYVDLDENEEEEIMEPVMEKIKDIVAQMPEETHQVDALIEETIEANGKGGVNLEEITSPYKDLPVFEPVELKDDAPRSLNESLRPKGIKIGLNDRLAFIKHLFDGNTGDYERVLNQIESSPSFKHATKIIQNIIKPEYNGWEGKEDYEERFMEVIENRFH